MSKRSFNEIVITLAGGTYKNYLPQIIEYLDLPPGYRFLIDDNGYEDVWFDPKLMQI